MVKQNFYAGKVFEISSVIGEGRISFRGEVLESYGHLCLVQETQAYITGGFKRLGIYKVVLDGKGVETFKPMMIDYSVGVDDPPRYIAPDITVRDKFRRLKLDMMTKESDAELKEDRKIKAEQEALAVKQLKVENMQYINQRSSEIVEELALSKPVRKITGDKKSMALLSELSALNMINEILKRT